MIAERASEIIRADRRARIAASASSTHPASSPAMSIA
jgi:hypothetical protein